MQRFFDTRTWIFDLDNTLYPAECNLFAQVDQRMGEFISIYLDIPFAEARKLQKGYYRSYGTTLSGLMAVHGLKPEKFLEYVHDIDVSAVERAPRLGAAIETLPGRKFIFTNGSRRHAENVAGALGILEIFDDIFDIGTADYIPKPDIAAYHAFLKAHGVKGEEGAMFEDMPHNLEAPHKLGMCTVLVHSRLYDHPVQHEIASWDAPPAHVHHLTENLCGFLEEVHAVLGRDGAALSKPATG